MELYVIRHAQSSNNALADATNRVCDPPLTELGHEQAARLAHHLASTSHREQDRGTDLEETSTHSVLGYGIKRLFCSAMERSIQTATAIGREIGVRPEIWTDVHEAGGIYLAHQDERGIVGYPGMTRTRIASDYPNTIIPPEVTDDGWWDPRRGEEDWPSCFARAIRVVSRLRAWAAESVPGPIAIVSHAGFMEAFLKSLFSRTPGDDLVFYHLNTAITRLDLEPTGRVLVRYINRVPHLPQDMMT